MAEHNGPILVIGATGQQGGAVARELLRRGHEVRALTRKPDAPAAQTLAERGAGVVGGDLDDPASIRTAMAGARAVFSVQTFATPAGVDGEVRQGKAVAEAAQDTGVRHLVYSSVDGAERGSGVPHFESKWAVERHLRALGVPATVLRPTMFMDNFATFQRPEIVDGTLVVRLGLRPDRPIQMVAVADLGAVAADVFERPDEYTGKSVAIAGDELTGPQIAAVFAEVSGTPARFEEQPVAQIRAFSEDLGLMFEWLNEHGYAVDLAALRQRHPGLRTLRRWLEETGWQRAVAA